MGISFLNPLFLLGLGIVAVPVIVHLVQSYRGERFRFPSLMFLESIRFHSIRRSKIRDVLLFLMRASAFVLLVLAFARPIVGRGGGEIVPVAGARDVVILLDGSYSMAYGDRWSRAVSEVRDVINRLGRGDRAALILFSEGAELVAPSTGDRNRLRAVLDALEPGNGVTQFGPALDLARQILEESDLSRREVLFVSDMQRIGWLGMDVVPLPSWVSFVPVDLSEPDVMNVAVSNVRFQRRYEVDGARLSLIAQVVNRSGGDVTDQEVTLTLNGVVRGSRTIGIRAGGIGTVEFEDVQLPESEVRGIVSVTADRLSGDNSYHFVVDAGRRYPVLIVEGRGARSTQSLFLQQALSIGDRPSYAVEVTDAGSADERSIEGRALVILNDAAAWGAENATALRSFVEGGGGLLVVLGASGRPDRSDADADLLIPAVEGAPREFAESTGGSIGELAFDHPVFEVFAAPHSGDFASVRIYRYHRLAPGWEGTVLARFSDGSPAMVEKRIGGGIVLAWASTLDTYWNDLALQPVFLPLVHRVAAYTTGYRQSEEAYVVGQSLQLRLPVGTEGRGVTALTPTGETVDTNISEGTLVLALEEPGIYELRDLPENWDGPRTIAVNRDPRESDLTSVDMEEFALAAQAAGPEMSEAGLEGELRPEVIERRQSFWWYLLLVVGLLLGIETVTANRLSRKDT